MQFKITLLTRLSESIPVDINRPTMWEALALFNCRKKRKDQEGDRRRRLAGTKGHPSCPQYRLIHQMWQLSFEHSVYFIWVCFGRREVPCFKSRRPGKSIWW